MELSTICGLDIFMVLYDSKTNKKVEYRSNPDFSLECIAEDATKEMYDNSDYDELMNKFTKKDQLKKIQQKHSEAQRPSEPAADSILKNVMKKRSLKVIEQIKASHS